ncbi:MAG: AAA family ATPase [Bacteroidota bacterium]
MITKINKIKDFGVFNNFNGSTLPEFKTFNLIYGWNYSGKTTLSRVFRCLEKSKLHDDYLTATFDMENTTAKFDSTFAVRPNIRVFNSDFVKENLKWDTDNIEPIFLLGAENIELQSELKQKETELATTETELAEANRLRADKLNRLNTALTNKAREITNLLSLGRTFDRDRLKQLVETVKDNVTNYTLSQSDFEKYKAQAISNEQKPPIGEITFLISDLATLKTKVEIILHRQAASTNKIQKLLDSKPISDWVETGKNLHEGKTNCEFCGNTLPHDLLAKLNEHFSKDYDQLKLDIEAKLNTLTASKINLTTPLPTETAFYIDIIPDFRAKKPLLETEITNFNNSIASLIKDLENKRDKPFDKIDATAFADNTATLETALTNFNEVIKTNDQRTAGFITKKNAAIEKLKEHFAAEFETNETYSAIQTQLSNEQTAIDYKGVTIESQKQAITLIKSQLDETVKGAELVNDYLKVFFGKDDVQIKPTSDKKFQLLRGTDIAKNLSEGEKTAISFAYFTAKLEEQNNKLSDTIIYIDDPISSLDSNHLFNIYSFIKNTFYEFKLDPPTNKKVHTVKCKQLFISTHNFDFHNLVFDWFKGLKKDNQAYWVIERHKNSHKDESVIKQNGNLLTSFNSEYAYLFSLLHNFQTNPTDTYDFLYHLPNVARRFVETFLNFKYLERNKIDESIDKLITNPVECERARKFMHYYSHNLTTEKFMKFADLAECQAVVDIIINSVNALDPIHLTSLKTTVTST